jgi:hypothetical protein
VVAAEIASRPTIRGVSHERRGGPAPTGAASPSARIGGSRTISATPARTMPPPIAYSVARGDTVVAMSTASAGPIMNEISTDIESSAYAGRRRSGGTRAASDCRTTENVGSISSPPTRAATTSSGYGSEPAVDQNNASATVVSTSTRRSPRRSISRPSSGAPSAAPIVAAAPTSPAAA